MERWYWIELIGFDNEADDFGVDAFLSGCVSVTGVSILFSHLDLFFEDDEALPERACSYFGHEYNKERRRQNWTRTQLRGLVRTLQSRGVKVFLSTFDMTERITDPDMRCYNASGAAERLVNPIKPLSEGRMVCDIIFDKLSKALDDFCFDGLQLADGLSSARLSIENGDFSLSLCRDSKIDIPSSLMTEGAESYAKRRAFILKRRRYEWTIYLADRWAELYERLFDRIKKPVMFNNAWTRDSFEALYRYGIDYRRCKAERAFAVMVEENSATRAITAARDEGGVEFPLSHRASFAYEYTLMQENLRLALDGLKQISLTPISDTMEQWDAIRHCPTELSRAIVRRYNNFVYRNGGFEVACDAPHYCLSDGVPRSDWEWLARQESYRIPSPDLIDGFVAVYNGGALSREVRGFIEKKEYYGSALLLEMAMGGINLGGMISLSETEGFRAARGLLVTSLSSYSQEDKQALAKTSLPILAIGRDVDLPAKCSARYDGKYISVALYNTDASPDLESLGALESKKTELSKIINERFHLDRCDDPEVKVTSFVRGNEKYLLLSNDSYLYNLPTVKTDAQVGGAIAMMKDDGYKVRSVDGGFTVRIPPRSAEIIKLEV